MLQLFQTVNSIDLSSSTGGAVIEFGTVRLTGDPTQSSQFGFDASGLTNEISDILHTPALDAISDALQAVSNVGGSNATPTQGFDFPLLDDPAAVIGKMLLGQDATLFSFTTGMQHVELAPSPTFGIPDVADISIAVPRLCAKVSMAWISPLWRLTTTRWDFSPLICGNSSQVTLIRNQAASAHEPGAIVHRTRRFVSGC